MLLELASLSKLEQSLRISTEGLMAEVERNPDNDNVFKCLALVSKFQQLQREIGHLTRSMLAAQPTAGAG